MTARKRSGTARQWRKDRFVTKDSHRLVLRLESIWDNVATMNECMIENCEDDEVEENWFEQISLEV
jgi:hypothetical protein